VSVSDDKTTRARQDEYVARYMEGGAAAIVSKKRMPRWWFALMGVPLVVLTIATIMAAAKVPAMIAVAIVEAILLVLVALVFSHLRLVVTDRALHIQLGLWGPKIPIERVRSIRALPYDWKKYGGWGIRLGRDGSWCYSVPGGSGECVEIEWVDDRGAPRKHVVSTDDGAAIVAAVERVRAAAGAESATRDARSESSTGVRVEAAEAHKNERDVDETVSDAGDARAARENERA
jgi:hypothetical protein